METQSDDMKAEAQGYDYSLHQHGIVVLVTTPSVDEATRIGLAVVDGGLAACANIVSQVKSIFRWEGKVSEETEVLLIFKSRSDLFPELSEAVRRLHSYRVPEVIALPIINGYPAYLKWITDSTRNTLK
jgi:periplasmic divalent cation tolerance protein